jgi:hypothetical protein
MLPANCGFCAALSSASAISDMRFEMCSYARRSAPSSSMCREVVSLLKKLPLDRLMVSNQV